MNSIVETRRTYPEAKSRELGDYIPNTLFGNQPTTYPKAGKAVLTMCSQYLGVATILERNKKFVLQNYLED